MGQPIRTQVGHVRAVSSVREASSGRAMALRLRQRNRTQGRYVHALSNELFARMSMYWSDTPPLSSFCVILGLVH
jgi:hypothetical protein